MNIRHLEVLLIIAVSVLLLSCATNSAQSLIKASKSIDPVIPDKEVVAQQLKGRAFRLGNVDYAQDAILENQADIAIEAYPVLLRDQAQKAFQSAALEQGELPTYQIDITIKQLNFTQGAFIIPDPSILHVTMEVIQPDGTTVMRGDFESRYMPMIPVIVPGVVGAIPTRFEGQEWQALGKIIPAMAVAITKVAAGLQAGKGLDEIEIYPEALEAGGIINPDSFLRGEPYGLSELTSEKIIELTKEAVQEHNKYDLKNITCEPGDFFPGWQFDEYQEGDIPNVVPYKTQVAAYLGVHIKSDSLWYTAACHLAIYDSNNTAIKAFKWHEQDASKGLKISKESGGTGSAIVRNISAGNEAFYFYTTILILEDPIHNYSIFFRRGRAVMHVFLSYHMALSVEEIHKMVMKIDSRLHGDW